MAYMKAVGLFHTVFIRAAQNDVPGPAGSPSSWSLLEVQNLKPIPNLLHVHFNKIPRQFVGC